MTSESKVKVGLKLEEQMLFKCDLGKFIVNDLYIDERNKKGVNKIGPSPAKLLGLSVLGCLAASFEFCLQKKDFLLSDIDGRSELIITRNEKGFWRIKKIDIEILPKVDNPKMRKRVDQCKKFFEQYCIISESLRKGIEVNINLEY
ncbi:MAG: OsmC family protein [Candidatus Lokiarchaeota archaeon]|nr:OsmC family protein [Candidatus Lokiarchaeota archaeon]